MDLQTTIPATENPFIKGFQQNAGTTSMGFASSASPSESDDLLQSMQDEQIKSIREAVADIQELIAERHSLHKEMFSHIDSVKMDLSNFLLEETVNLSHTERLEVRKKIAQLEELKIGEKLNAWRDIADLKRELRERIKDLTDRESRADIIDQILID